VFSCKGSCPSLSWFHLHCWGPRRPPRDDKQYVPLALWLRSLSFRRTLESALDRSCSWTLGHARSWVRPSQLARRSDLEGTCHRPRSWVRWYSPRLLTWSSTGVPLHYSCERGSNPLEPCLRLSCRLLAHLIWSRNYGLKYIHGRLSLIVHSPLVPAPAQPLWYHIGYLSVKLSSPGPKPLQSVPQLCKSFMGDLSKSLGTKVEGLTLWKCRLPNCLFQWRNWS